MTRLSGARSALLTGAALAMVATGVAGCSGSANNVGSGGGNGTLVIGVDNGSPTLQDNFNPFSPNKRIGTTYMYEPLEYVNAVNGHETPFLATGHTLRGATEVDYAIRKGVTWSDGKPFTPADVVFTFDFLKKFPALDSTGIWQHVASVTSSGDTVAVTFKQPDVPFVQQIDQEVIVPQHVWSKITDPTTYTNTSPVVTGPYVLGTFNPNQYTLTRNQKYWQVQNVAAAKLVFPALTGNAQSQLQLSRGGYDWASLFIPNVNQTWVKKDARHNQFWFPPGGTISLYLNLTKAPYNSLAFRQGLSDALNRKDIADKAEDGYVQPASQSGLLLPNLRSWLDPSLPDSGVVTQDTAKATQLFGQAGYHVRGNALVGPNGKPVTMNLQTPNGFTDWLQGAQAIQQQLKAVGITVNIQTPEFAAYNQALQQGSFDASLGSFGGTGSPYVDFFNTLASAQTAPVGKTAGSNFSRFSDPKLDGLLSQMQGETQLGQQQNSVHQLEQVMYQQVPVIALFYGATWGEFSTKGFTGWPTASNPYAPPAPYLAPPLMIVTHLKAVSS
ncbi:MAG TPA: ABC transporter substrate-binding protein [Pseudonocardiaceae bacterium]|nr:ABC transporter substrate-binding protein [Pseudonocardiaceae bacterium]